MRPLIRTNGEYYAKSFESVQPLGKTDQTDCLAICVIEEIKRLDSMIKGKPAASAISVAITKSIDQFKVNEVVTIPELDIPAVPAAGFAGGTYEQAMEMVPLQNRSLVNNYIHYYLIMHNLKFELHLGFLGNSLLVLGDIPYAVSAMQDAREQVRAKGHNANLYYTKGDLLDSTYVVIADPENDLIKDQKTKIIKSYNIEKINTHIISFYNTWITYADKDPSDYRNAGPELVEYLGPYCAYCEANLKDQIHVEHILPKGKVEGFPSHAKYWLNFLPSCSSCNTYKGSKPAKNEILKLASKEELKFIKDDMTEIVVNMNDTRITDLEYARLCRDYYQFPVDDTSYKNVGFALWNETDKTVDNTAFTKQIKWNIKKIDEKKKIVLVNAGPADCEYRVYIDNGTYGANLIKTPDKNLNKVSKMANICGLNKAEANTDRRVLERTEAWFMALEAIRNIDNSLKLLPEGTSGKVYNITYELWRDSIIMTIKEKGFFTVWLKIFSEFDHPLAAIRLAEVPCFPNPLPAKHVAGADAGKQMTLAQDIATQIMNSRYFPGTNFAQVP